MLLGRVVFSIWLGIDRVRPNLENIACCLLEVIGAGESKTYLAEFLTEIVGKPS